MSKANWTLGLKEEKKINIWGFDADRLGVGVYNNAIFYGFVLFLGVFMGKLNETQAQNATSKLSGSNLSTVGEDLPLFNKETGKTTSVGEVLDASTEAGFDGMSGPEYTSGNPEGLYYTGSKNPAYTPEKPTYTPPAGSSESSSPQMMMPGLMNLVQRGMGIFQPLSNLDFGKSPKSDVCEDCEQSAEYSSELGSSFDPNLYHPAAQLINGSDNPGNLMADIYNRIGLWPFQKDSDTILPDYLSTLHRTLEADPFAKIMIDGSEELRQFCPRYNSLNRLEKSAIVSLVFSEIMRHSDGKFRETASQGSRKGLCLSDYTVVSRFANNYPDFINLDEESDLYQPETSIRACVMEIYENLILAQASNQPIRPFQDQKPARAQAAKDKISNLDICKAATGTAPVPGAASTSTGGSGPR